MNKLLAIIFIILATGPTSIFVSGCADDDDDDNDVYLDDDDDNDDGADYTIFSNVMTDNFALTQLNNGNVLLAYRETETRIGKWIVIDDSGSVAGGPYTFEEELPIVNEIGIEQGDQGDMEIAVGTTASGTPIVIYSVLDDDKIKAVTAVLNEAGDAVVSTDGPIDEASIFVRGFSPTPLAEGGLAVVYGRQEYYDEGDEGYGAIINEDGSLQSNFSYISTWIADPRIVQLSGGNLLISYTWDFEYGQWVTATTEGTLAGSAHYFDQDGGTHGNFAFELDSGNLQFVYTQLIEETYIGRCRITNPEDIAATTEPIVYDTHNVDYLSAIRLSSGDILAAYYRPEDVGRYVVLSPSCEVIAEPTPFIERGSGFPRAIAFGDGALIAFSNWGTDGDPSAGGYVYLSEADIYGQ